jgi:hypothetical protein
MEAMIHRYDLVTSATRLFLENATYSESVTLQRCARLLASELAAWVIVDVERRQRLRRQFVMGPENQPSDLANAVGQVDPAPGTAPRQVHESGSSLLVAHAEDAGILGAAGGVPVADDAGCHLGALRASVGWEHLRTLRPFSLPARPSRDGRPRRGGRTSASSWPWRSGWTGCSGGTPSRGRAQSTSAAHSPQIPG